MTPSRFPTDAPLCIDPALLMAPPSPISSAPFQQSNTYRASTGTPIVDDTYDSAASNLATPSSSNVYQSARSAPSTFSKHTSDIDDPFGLVASNLVEPSTSNEYSSITHEPYTFNTTSFTGNSYIGSPFNLSAGGLLEPSNNNGYPSMTKNAYTLGTHDFTGISNIGSLFDPRAGNLLEHSTSNMYSPMTNDPSTLGTYAFTGNSCVDNPLDLYASRSWEPSMGNAYSSMTNNSHNLATNHSPLLYKSTASNSVSDIEQFLTYNDETISYDGSSPATTIDVHQFQVSSFREHIARILARRQREHDHQTARIEGQGHQNPEQHKLLHDSEPGTCELTNPAQVHGEYEELNTPNKEQIFQDPSQHSDHHGNRSKGRKPRKKASKPSASSRKRKNRSNDDQQSPSKKAKEAPEPLVKSKLSLKRDIMANKYGEDRVTKLATVKGEIRHNVDGSIDYWCSLEMRWRPAVYHDDIRDELIKLDEVDQPEAYAAAPAAGGHKLDITSNCNVLDQHKWDYSTAAGREQIRDKDGNPVYQFRECMKTSGIRHLYGPREDKLFFNGKMVLSADNLPVRALRCLPRVISSQIEGGHIESLKRAFPFISIEDIRSRQPKSVIRKGKTKPRPGLSGLRLRASRFRDGNGIAAIKSRAGSGEE